MQDSNEKSHTCFRLVPKSMILDDLERPKCHSCEKIILRTHRKNLNEDRPILSAAECRSMILISRNVRYMLGLLSSKDNRLSTMTFLATFGNGDKVSIIIL